MNPQESIVRDFLKGSEPARRDGENGKRGTSGQTQAKTRNLDTPISSSRVGAQPVRTGSPPTRQFPENFTNKTD
jgi:hypothetical protein